MAPRSAFATETRAAVSRMNSNPTPIFSRFASKSVPVELCYGSRPLTNCQEFAAVGRTKIRVRVEFRDGAAECVCLRDSRCRVPHEFESDTDFLPFRESKSVPLQLCVG